jgi:hypothetical protein
VGWNARRGSIRAVADAMPALMKAEAVEVLVIDHERTAGHGQEPAAEVARHLARRGVKVETRRLSSAKEKDEWVAFFSRKLPFSVPIYLLWAPMATPS